MTFFEAYSSDKELSFPPSVMPPLHLFPSCIQFLLVWQLTEKIVFAQNYFKADVFPYLEAFEV